MVKHKKGAILPPKMGNILVSLFTVCSVSSSTVHFLTHFTLMIVESRGNLDQTAQRRYRSDCIQCSLIWTVSVFPSRSPGTIQEGHVYPDDNKDHIQYLGLHL